MRNLKKILALVLALVMSLSLMATAGATDFKDDGDISDTYRQAAQVLFELGVFNGDQNGKFNPDQPINRAEVAAILYRIATGDIGLEGNKTYAPYNQFPDVNAEDWYAGYVTYCGNAGYIKGRSKGEFDAKSDVTGYEVLAMILRAVGYDKQNEFVGSDWQLHTASLAREKGVLVNVLEDPNVKLSEAATREVVAELLFRASLLPQVTYNAATLSYVEDGETLAKANLGMERIEGVVVANEWADLRYDYIDVDEDETVLETADGERTLAVPTDLTDIGESRYAYVVGTKVLGQLEDTGKNVTKDCVDLDPQGKATRVSALADELKLTDDTQYFINFSDFSYDKSEYRIEYSISFRNQDALEWFQARYLGWTAANGYSLEYLRGLDNADRDPKDIEYLNKSGTYYTGTKGDGTEGGLTYSRVIPAGDTITWLDKAIMQGIFGSAASFDSAHKNFSELSDDIVHAGYVYAGSKSNPNTADSKDDLSDDRTYQQFEDEYIGISTDAYFTNTTNGVWLKVIDNNNDNKADFVLGTIYDLVEVDSYNTRNDAYYFSNDTDTANDVYALRDSEYEFNVGDMLLMAYIDGQYVVEESESEILVIEKYSWKDVSVTTRDGDVKYESGADIGNLTGYADRIEDMVYGVEYEVFYDHYGFIRAYRPVNGDRNYGLLTDLWLINESNTHYIDNQTAKVELSFVDENGKLDMDEYVVSNHSKTTPNVFVGINQAVAHNGIGDTDNLQRAIAHLGMSYMNGSTSTAWSDKTRNPKQDKYEDNGVTVLGNEFDYDANSSNNTNYDGTTYDAKDSTDAKDGIDFSWTNMARYSFNEDGTVNLSTVSEYAYDKAGNQLFYWKGTSSDFYDVTKITAIEGTITFGVGGTRATAADWRAAYVQANSLDESTPGVTTTINTALELNVLGHGGHLVPVYAVDYVMLEKAAINNKSYHLAIDDSYDNGSNLTNNYVNAVADTLFYIVTPTEVYPIVGYTNLPSIAATDVHAIYAVAKNVEQDNYGFDYWVADVVVIEVEALDNVYSYMIYNIYDNYRAGQKAIIHELDAIDCRTGELVSVVVDSSWTQAYNTGFYLLSEAEVASDGSITAKGMITVEDYMASERVSANEYADFGIYAGKVIRSNEIENRASYIDVFDEYTDTNADYDTERVLIGTAPWYSVYATSATEAAKSAGRLYAEALSSRDYAETSPNGNEVIYVVYQNVVRFIIDTTFKGGRNWFAPTYLNDGTTGREWPNAQGEGGTSINTVYENAIVQQTVAGNGTPGVNTEMRTIVFSRETVAPQAREAIDIADDAKLTDVFSSIKIGTTSANMVEVEPDKEAGTFSARVPNATKYYYELTANDGWDVDSISFDSSNADVDHDRGSGTGDITGFSTNINVQIQVVINCDSVTFDEDDVAAAELARYKAAAKALVDEYVAAEIAKVTDADAKAILEANVNETGSVLKTAIDKVKGTDSGMIGNSSVDTKAKVDAIIAKSESGTWSGSAITSEGEIFKALGAVDAANSQLKAIADARSEAVSALTTRYNQLKTEDQTKIFNDYIKWTAAINGALTTAAITSAKEAGLAALEVATIPTPQEIGETQKATIASFGATDAWKGIENLVSYGATGEQSADDPQTMMIVGTPEKVFPIAAWSLLPTNAQTRYGATPPADATKFAVVPLYFYYDMNGDGEIDSPGGDAWTYRFIVVTDSKTVTSNTDNESQYVGNFPLTYDWSNLILGEINVGSAD